MEVGEIQTQAYKFPRIGNGISRNIDSTKIGPDDEDQDGGHRHRRSMTIAAAVGGAGGGNNRLRGWNHSRIIRVSRSSGGKDRHSKVLTSKGLRDRRVRLSVATAIQFYDIQDRLGYDQPSKAVEWLIEAARASIAELPSLSGSFPETPRQFSDEKRGSDGAEQEHGLDSAEADLDGEPSFQQQQNQNLSLSKSACSSTSETSKGSGLSLSRSEIRDNRVRARERARERAAKEKEKDTNHHNLNPVSHNSSSFTELLTGAISTVNTNTTTATNTTSSPSGDGGGEVNIFHKAARQWSSPSMEYFTTGLLGAQLSRAHHHHPSVFSGQIPMGNTNSVSQVMQVPAFTISAEGGNHQELPQHFSFVPDHLIPVAAAPSTTGLEYNLNVSISSASSASSGLGGFTRGTLQSNSSTSLLPHQLQRFSSSPIDGPNVPFFIGTATPVDTSNHHQHHHHHHHHHPNNHIAQFPSGFDGRLQLCYGDPPPRQSDQKVKPKN